MRPSVYLSALLVLAFFIGAAQAVEPDDASITASIQARLAGDALLASGKIAVVTHDGLVHMEGLVASADAARRAIYLAEATDGVRGVWVDFEAAE